MSVRSCTQRPFTKVVTWLLFEREIEAGLIIPYSPGLSPSRSTSTSSMAWATFAPYTSARTSLRSPDPVVLTATLPSRVSSNLTAG